MVPARKWSRPKGSKSDMVETFTGSAFLTAFGAGVTVTCFSGSLCVGGGCTVTVRTFGEQAAVTSAIIANKYHLFPLNGCRRFRTDVIYYPVNSFYVVNDLVADFRQQIVWQVAPVGGHPV